MTKTAVFFWHWCLHCMTDSSPRLVSSLVQFGCYLACDDLTAALADGRRRARRRLELFAMPPSIHTGRPTHDDHDHDHDHCLPQLQATMFTASLSCPTGPTEASRSLSAEAQSHLRDVLTLLWWSPNVVCRQFRAPRNYRARTPHHVCRKQTYRCSKIGAWRRLVQRRGAEIAGREFGGPSTVAVWAACEKFVYVSTPQRELSEWDPCQAVVGQKQCVCIACPGNPSQSCEASSVKALQ